MVVYGRQFLTSSCVASVVAVCSLCGISNYIVKWHVMRLVHVNVKMMDTCFSVSLRMRRNSTQASISDH